MSRELNDLLNMLLCLSRACPSSNLIGNGGFESGMFDPFVLTGARDFTGVGTPGSTQDLGQQPNSGAYFAYFGSHANAVLSQDLPSCAAPTCLLSFSLANDVDCASGQCYFSAAVGSQVLFSSTSNPSLTAKTNGYQQLSSNFIMADASQAVTFMFMNVAGHYALDDVSVTCTA